MFWTFLVTHLWSGFRYFQIGVYPPLGSLWGAPLLSTAAYCWS